MVQRISLKQYLFISAFFLLILFPFPAIILKVVVNGVKFYLTGELNANY